MAQSRKWSRREFLRIVPTLAAAGVVAACSPASTPTAEPASKARSNPDLVYGKYPYTVSLATVRWFDVTDQLPQGDTLENNQYTRYIREMLNIDTRYLWTATSTDYPQKVNLAIASNDLPDAMVVNLAQFRQMVKADQLADLTDAYNKHISPKVKQMLDSHKGLRLQGISMKDQIMAIPSTEVSENGYHLTWIRKDWLDQLSLDVPKTMDDLENVARAFIEKDPGRNGPNKTIGVIGPQTGGNLHADFISPSNNSFGFDPIFSAYRSYPGFWLKGSDGKAIYGSILPETKTALAKLAELYKKGLIDKEIGVRKDSTDPITNGKAGIFFGMWWAGYWPLPAAVQNNPMANWQAYAVPLDDQGVFNPHMSVPAITFLVVRKGYEHEAAVIKIININNRDESKFDISKGSVANQVLRLPQAMYDENPVTYQALKDVLSNKASPEDFTDPKWDVYKLLKDDVSKIKEVKRAPIDRNDIQYWNRDADPSAWNRLYSIMVGCGAIYQPIGGKINEVYSLSYAPTTSVDSKWTSLKKLEEQAFFKMILGSTPVDSFDQFVSDWKSQGGDQVTTDIQAEINQMENNTS